MRGCKESICGQQMAHFSVRLSMERIPNKVFKNTFCKRCLALLVSRVAQSVTLLPDVLSFGRFISAAATALRCHQTFAAFEGFFFISLFIFLFIP